MLRHQRRTAEVPVPDVRRALSVLARWLLHPVIVSIEKRQPDRITMSQRSKHHSEAQNLEGDDGPDTRDVERIKQATAVDLTQRVYIGWKRYHVTPGCPNGAWTEATVETAIEQNISPCDRCDPPDYRRADDGETIANSNETTEHETHARNENSADQQANRDRITHPFPDTKPTKASDLDQIILARGNIRRKAHIPASSDPTEPLCIVTNLYNGSGNWTIKSQKTHPNVNERFEVCDLCLRAYDQINGEEEA
jgi:hypothetical protein